MASYHGYKYRIYPNAEQRNQIDATIEARCKVYNSVRAILESAVRNGKKLPSTIDIGYSLKAWKQDSELLRQADSQALLHAVRDAHQAWALHFGNPAHFGMPKPRHYDSMKGSYRTTATASVRIVVLTGKNARIRLPKLGLVKLRLSRKPLGTMKNVTIEKKSSGKYYIAICCEGDDRAKPSERIALPKTSTMSINAEKSQARADREFVRLKNKTTGSNNYRKQRRVYARACERAANIRQANNRIKQSTTIAAL